MQPLTLSHEDGKLLIILDASAFSESSCLLKLFYTTVLGLRTRVNNNDMEFGTAFHKFRAHFREFGSEGMAEALILARDYYKTTPMVVKSNKKYLNDFFLTNVCINYATKYENDNFQPLKDDDGKAMLELKFAPRHLIYVDDQMEIMLAGTIDEVGKFNNGINAAPDCKTTSVWDIEGYFKSYLLSPQLIFYRWIIREYAKEFPDSIMGKIDAEGCGVFIDGIFYAGKVEDVKFERSKVWIFKEETLDEFTFMLRTKIGELVGEVSNYLTTGKIPMRYGMLNGACSTKFGPCKYSHLCAAVDDVDREAIMEHSFIKQQYNPLSFH